MSKLASDIQKNNLSPFQKHSPSNGMTNACSAPTGIHAMHGHPLLTSQTTVLSLTFIG
jgi:hypothetical protein